MARYDKQPVVVVPERAGDAWRGWDEVLRQLDRARANRLVIDCYPGVDCAEIRNALTKANPALTIIDPGEALKPAAVLDQMLARFLTEDRVFGYMSPFTLDEFFDRTELTKLKARLAGARAPIAVVGVGAALVSHGDCLVIADMPRWEIQLRYRAGLANWTADNPQEDFLRKYKRAFFIEWRAADRHKLRLFETADFFLDTTARDDPKLVGGEAMRAALEAVTRRPFRVVPFFDPGVWGGQWMRDRFDLPSDKPNYAWGFDCVPEENSLLLAFGPVTVEIPSINLVLRHPKPLLGEKVHARFGAEFPIRFDFLDTMGGGNLSLQVHPVTDYARQAFGIAYTQDESYYILDAGPGAAVYLGLRNGIAPDALFRAVEGAQNGGVPLDAERFVNRLPAARHDHISIPAGTVHCAGRNCMVLEISATPYIFTFKLWDWGRLGLDGRPRPVHLDHGRQVLQGDRDTGWVERTTLNLVQPVAEGDGWREERTGLHELEFIETRRHWFTKPVTHETRGSVHVINLVEGDAAVIESPDGAFAPVPMSFAETVIIPASLGTYRVTPGAGGVEHATIRASVRI
jgi:mannose-6-phosphate isomerase class I